MTKDEMLNRAAVTGTSELINNIVSGKWIIWYGIVMDVPADGIVTVASAAADSGEHVLLTDCVLACTAGASLSVSVVPHEGDKVLVFSPKAYSDEMFKEESDKPIVEPLMNGYVHNAGIAVLLNQFQPFHKNSVVVEDGTVEARLAFDKDASSDDKDVNHLHAVINADGSVLLETAYLSDDEAYDNVLEVTANGSWKFSRKYLPDDKVYDHVEEQVIGDDGITRTVSDTYLSDDGVYDHVEEKAITADGVTRTVSDGYISDKSVYTTVETRAQTSAGTDITLDNGYVSDNDAYEQHLEMKADGNLAYSCGFDKDNSVYKSVVKVMPDGTLTMDLAEKDGAYQGALAVAGADGTLTYTMEKTTVTVMGDGNVTVENENGSVALADNGSLTVTAGDTTVSIADKAVSVDDGTNKITTGSSGVSITDGNGKIEMSSGAITLQGTGGGKVEIS